MDCAKLDSNGSVTSSENMEGGESPKLVEYRDAPKLVSILNEMKAGLDIVTAKVQALTQKVKQNQYPTRDGISYMEAKHLLLFSYCQSIVYYMLRKAEGLPVAEHPVVRSLVEIRLFLEKIRPIDKKMEYQIQKLTRAATDGAADNAGPQEERKAEPGDVEDPLKFKPNPDMLVSKTKEGVEEDGGVYRPARFAPTSMDNDRMSREEKQALRKEKHVLRQAKQSPYLKELLDEIEGKPEEVREAFGSETKELKRYKEALERRARQEEELFTRAPITKREKKLEKRLLKSRHGLQGLLDDFTDEINTFPSDKIDKDGASSYFSSRAGKKSSTRKRKR